jgi:hypothetical protein
VESPKKLGNIIYLVRYFRIITNSVQQNALKTNTGSLRKKTIKKNVLLNAAGLLIVAPVYSIGGTIRKEFRKERNAQ